MHRAVDDDFVTKLNIAKEILDNIWRGELMMILGQN